MKKTTSLSVAERIRLMDILPNKSSLFKKLIAEQIQKKVFFTTDEVKAMDIDTDGAGKWTWNTNKESPASFSFTSDEKELILECIKKADESEEVDSFVLRLAEKFGYSGKK